MRFIVTSNALLKNLQQISGVISSNTVLSVLEDFLFELSGTTLTLTATDLETMMRVQIANMWSVVKVLMCTCRAEALCLRGKQRAAGVTGWREAFRLVPFRLTRKGFPSACPNITSQPMALLVALRIRNRLGGSNELHARIANYGMMLCLAMLLAGHSAIWVGLLVAASIAIVTLTGLSRIYLGVHFPSDVLGGFSMGVIWCAVCYFALLPAL